jgi:polysaccharide deacetylase 2 family uncharacterized protein YibQ
VLRSRRSRSRRAAGAAQRRSGGWRAGRDGDAGSGGGRWLALAVIAAALLVAGYGLGRWSASRAPAQIETETSPIGPAPNAAAEAFELDDPSPASALAPARPAAIEPSSDLALDAESVAPLASAASSTIAIVIDDLGRSLEVIDELRGFGVRLTYAVLPFEARTAAVAARLDELGEEILCHLPMEAQHGVDPGPGALHGAMDADQIRASTRQALAAVPGATGVNNHMGSSLSEDRTAMAAMLEVVRAKRLFFLDSRTSAASVAYSLARDGGVPAAERKVFLDGDREPAAIRGEFRRLLALADAGGPAIAIGHPYPETLALLAEEIPRARALGYRFARVSEVIEASRSEPPAPGAPGH